MRLGPRKQRKGDARLLPARQRGDRLQRAAECRRHELGVGRRTLERRFLADLGQTPLKVYLDSGDSGYASDCGCSGSAIVGTDGGSGAAPVLIEGSSALSISLVYFAGQSTASVQLIPDSEPVPAPAHTTDVPRVPPSQIECFPPRSGKLREPT